MVDFSSLGEIDSAIGLAQKEATNKSIELSRQGLSTLQKIAYDALIKGQNLLGNQINLATYQLLALIQQFRTTSSTHILEKTITKKQP
nr:1974_t:CDS:2 [Entrophospora candida]